MSQVEIYKMRLIDVSFNWEKQLIRFIIYSNKLMQASLLLSWLYEMKCKDWLMFYFEND